MSFADKILKLRKQAGLSQEELATRLDVSRQAVSRWEMGSALPDVGNLLQLSRLFGVSADYLIDDSIDDSAASRVNAVTDVAADSAADSAVAPSDATAAIDTTTDTSIDKLSDTPADPLPDAPDPATGTLRASITAAITAAAIATAIALIVALTLFPLSVHVAVLGVPLVAMPFPAFYLSQRKGDAGTAATFVSSLITFFVVIIVTIVGLFVTCKAIGASLYFIMWDRTACLIGSLALASFGLFVPFTAKRRAWWISLFIYMFTVQLLSVIAWQTAGLEPRDVVMLVYMFAAALICAAGCAVYVVVRKRNSD